MPSITFTIKYKKNEGLVMSPEEVLALYFYGVKINNSTDGSKIDNYTIRTYILQAQSEVEKYFNIRLFPQLVTEKCDYYRGDYTHNFPFVNTELPVRNARTLIGMLNGLNQIRYPEEWLQNRTTNQNTYQNKISIVPNGSLVNADANVILVGFTANYGLRSQPHIPNYWYIQYETGFPIGELPMDLLHLIGMMASIPMFAIAGDLILGAGIANQSLSIDNLSQSIGSTSSATNSGYGARIIEYRKSIKETVDRLKRYYKGITFTTM